MVQFVNSRAVGLATALLTALTTVTAQVPIPIPAVTGGNGGGNVNCGGCYVVADVAGIAFGSETLTQTQTNSVVVVSGLNSTFTTTSIVFEQGQFTFTSGALVSATALPAASGSFGANSLVINGVTL